MLSQAIISHQKTSGKEESKCLNLVQDVPTHWNSTFLMLERFLTLQDSVKALLLDEEWKKKLKVSIRSDEWILMERVVKVLKIFSDATLQFSSASACISEVVPTISSILFALGPGGAGDHGVKDLKKRINANIISRLGNKETYENYSVATLLDPRYKASLSVFVFIN